VRHSLNLSRLEGRSGVKQESGLEGLDGSAPPLTFLTECRLPIELPNYSIDVGSDVVDVQPSGLRKMKAPRLSGRLHPLSQGG
jgi:hypothetical protein